MALRRMFSQKIVGSDAFLEMSTSTRELYFQLGMYADDDGFISPRKIMRMIGASDDDLKMLVAKKFVLPFDNGVLVIKHWKMNNEIKSDRYKSTEYYEQKQMLFLKENNAYTFDSTQGISLIKTKCIQNVSKTDTQVRLGKDRLGKDREILNPPSEELIAEMTLKYECTPTQVKNKCDAIINYCDSKTKTYKDYKAVLRTWLNKDFGLRKIDPLLK